MFVFSDLVIHSVIENGLKDLRDNADVRIPQLYSQLKESYFDEEYGQAEMQRFKEWLLGTKIDIVQSWRQATQRIPNICILTVNSGEDLPRAIINDYSGDVDTFDNDGNLIGRNEEKTVPVGESLQISIHVGDPGKMTALRWLYAALNYWIVSRKKEMLAKGIFLSSWSSTDFNKLNEYMPDNVYSRYLTLTLKNDFSWINLEQEPLIKEIIMSGPDKTPGRGGLKTPSGKAKEYESQTFYTIGGSGEDDE